jgi:hypothetical protein
VEYIHGTLIYLASQPQRPQQVRDAIANWSARHAEFDHAPDVVEVPPGKYDPSNPAMIVHLWFGNDVATDRAEADAAWATIQGLNLNWVQSGSKIEQGTDSTDPTTILQTRSF